MSKYVPPVWFLLIFWSCPLWAQPVTQSPPLTQTGQRVEREWKGGEEHRYPLPLLADTYVKVTVAAQGVGVEVWLQDAQGQRVAAGRDERSVTSVQELVFLAPANAEYQLLVQAQGAATKASQYTLTVNALRVAGEPDRHYAAAHQLSQEAVELISKRTADGRRGGLAKLQEALPHWRTSGSLTGELETLRLSSDTRFVLGEHRAALTLAQELLSQARAAGLRRWELTGLKYVGALQNSLGENVASRQTLEQALALSRELHERLDERGILNNLGITLAQLGQTYAAIEYYQQALALAREIRDRSGEAVMLRNLAVRYQNVGEPELALTHLQQALVIQRELRLVDAEASTLLELSRLQGRLGEMQQAVALASQAQEKLHAAGRQDNEALAFLQRAGVYHEMREFPLAVADLQQAITLYRRTENRSQLGNALRLLGRIERSQGNTAEAQRLLQEGLALYRSLGTSTGLSGGLMQLGEEALAQGDPQQALALLTEALTLMRQQRIGLNEANALYHLSRTQHALGDHAKAQSLLQEALTLSRTVKNRLLEADIRHDLARFALQQGQITAAQTHLETALQITEQARRGLVNPATRAEYRRRQQNIYELSVETLLQRRAQEGNEPFTAQALALVEQSRARSWLDLLQESQVDIRQGVAPELLAQERSLHRRLAAKTEQVTQLSASKTQQAQAQTLEAEIVKLTAELTAVETRIRAASPAYAALTQPQPLTLEAIQTQVLDRDTLLLEYALGTERSYVFAVTPTTAKVFPLPKRAEMEATVRPLLDRLRRNEQPPAFPSLAAQQQWRAKAEQEIAAATAAVSQIILQPVAAELANKRLLIVPDGLLHYVPFAALPEPVVGGRSSVVGKKQNQSPATNHQPLIVRHELLTLPSASTLAVLRQELAGRAPAPKLLAVLADPVFSATDERVKTRQTPTLAAASANMTAPRTRALQAWAGVTEMNAIPRLPASRTEAEAILALVPAASRRAALDFAANPTTLQNGAFSQYRYVHFATHGLLHPTQPELTGLLLSLVNEDGQAQPGFLNSREIYQLKLPAELVTLSACQTALGKEAPGEGLIGLTRGFMYAGAKRVLASLWRVDDEATAVLMKAFYQELLAHPTRPPAAALRTAQIKLWRSPRWRSPYYWAGFVLQGEW